MLFKTSQLDGIADGTIDLTFRRWPAPRVRAGSRQRTAIGVIDFDAVEIVEDLTTTHVARAGPRATRCSRRSGAARATSIASSCISTGPTRARCCASVRATGEELAELRRRVERMGPWAMHYLHAIAARPGVRAPDLAADFGLETRAFKLRVRRLKELGLTESLRIGYRVSPRGEAFLTERGPARRRAR